MTFCYSKFSSLAFLGKPRQHTLPDGWNIQYLSFCLPKNEHKSPVVFLGGAFQTFFSFKKDVQVMMEEYPILLVDLPSQGSNAQLSEQLSFEDYARLLRDFIDQLGFARITPIGLSYGSATAFYFASLYPERTHKLILGGTTPRVRDSYRALLEDTFTLLEQGEMNMFSQGAVMNLINYSKRHQTKIPERVIKGFYKNMMGLTPNEKLRYRHNTERLLQLDGVQGRPECQTLVLTGEFDNFTTPHENYEMAKLIPQSTFLLIDDADHLANLEKRDVVIKAYMEFLSEGDLESVTGLSVMTPERFAQRDRRLDTRLRPEMARAIVTDASGRRHIGEVEDIHTSGCQIRFENNIWEHLNLDGHIELKLDDCPSLDLTAHVLRKELISIESVSGPTRLNCIFRRGDFQLGQDLESYVDSLSESSTDQAIYRI